MKHEESSAEVRRTALSEQFETLRPSRVLLAEDDDELRHLLAKILRRDGFDVVEARDGADLLECVDTLTADPAATVPDLIVSDIRMPGFSGLDVLWALRRGSCATPMILLTAFGTIETREEAKRLGAVAVLDKPLDPAVLIELLHALVGRPSPSRPPEK